MRKRLTQGAFEVIAITMIEFRKEMEYFDAIGTVIATKARFIMRMVFSTHKH